MKKPVHIKLSLHDARVLLNVLQSAGANADVFTNESYFKIVELSERVEKKLRKARRRMEQ